MKKIILTIVIISIALKGYSQETTAEDIPKNYNELKLNGLFLIIGAFDVTYERTLNEESALGISVFLPFDEDIKDDLRYYVSPYYRLYFGNKYAAGFFLEGFGMLNNYKSYDFQYNDDIDFFVETEEYKTDFALGIGLGGKWVTNNGFIGELNLGIGRNLFNTDDSDEEFVGKVGVTLGYRF